MNTFYQPPSSELKDLINKSAVGMDGGAFIGGSGIQGPLMSDAAAALTNADIERYQKDGYIIVRNAIAPEHFPAIKAVYTHLQENPSLYTRAIDSVSCSSSVFGSDRLLPEFASILYRLNLHWIAQRLLGTKTLILMNSILHYNLGNCKREGSILSTHNDYFSLPFSVERRPGKDGFFGDNGLVGWIAIDEISPQAVTMQLGKGTHLRYTKTYPEASRYHQNDFCPLMWEDFAKEDQKIADYMSSFIELPVLHPGDAVFFNGFTSHRPVPYCKNGCNKTNSRRMTIRYIDGERTTFRTDVPSQATHYQVRWCPSLPFRLMGEPCRIHAGMDVRSAPLPVVIELDENRGGRRIPTDGLPAFHEPEPWGYYFGMGTRVHHDTCGLENAYIEKTIRRIMHRTFPALQMLLWGESPKPRPGEELIWNV